MVHVTNVIKYILVFIVNLLLLLFLHSYFNFVVLVVLVVFPFVSVFIALIASRHISVEIGGGLHEAKTDEPIQVNIVVSNKSIFPVMNVDVDIYMENGLFHVGGEHRLSVPSYAHAANIVDYEIAGSMVGVIEIYIKRMYVTDWLGFVRLKRKCDAVREIKVFPDGEIKAEPDMTAIAEGMNEAEETRQKGNDFSEVVDIREYRPGDKMQNIHWKLSAGKEEFMVKERESMSSDQLAIFVDLANDEKNMLNDVLKAAYGFGRYLIAGNIPYTIYHWSVNGDDMVETVVGNAADIHDWMDRIFYETPYAEYGLGNEMMQRMFDSDKKVFVITAADSFDEEILFTYGERVKGYIRE